MEEENDGPTYAWRDGLPGGPSDGTPQGRTPRVAYIRLDTDAGITGSLQMPRGNAVADTILRRYKPLIGENVLLTEHLWKKIWEIDRIEEFQINQFGMLDLLAWDVKSKLSGLPLHQLLGGYNPIVRAYASTATYSDLKTYEHVIKDCMQTGFTAFKLHAWGDLRRDAELCRELRRWTGDEAILMYDGSAAWCYEDALQFGHILEELRFYWYEEPMREFDLYSYQKLCDDLTIPVLAAETTEGSHWNCATWIRLNALDMVRTCTLYKGGVTGALKIAHLAESHGMKAQVHGMGIAEAQLAAAIPNNDFYEQIIYDRNHVHNLGDAVVPVVDGCISVGDEPGLGPEPDWDWLEKNAVAVI